MHYDYGQSPDRPTSISLSLTPARSRLMARSAPVPGFRLKSIAQRSIPLTRTSSVRLSCGVYNTLENRLFLRPAGGSLHTTWKTNHMNKSLYRPEILRHFTAPANCTEPANYSVKASLHNPVCGDQITLFLTVDSERISGAHFTGSGCAICIASASMMTIKLTGVAVSEAQDYHWAMENVLAGSADDPFVCDVIRPLTAVTPYRGRHKCALLAWRTLDRALVSLSTGGER